MSFDISSRDLSRCLYKSIGRWSVYDAAGQCFLQTLRNVEKRNQTNYIRPFRPFWFWKQIGSQWIHKVSHLKLWLRTNTSWINTIFSLEIYSRSGDDVLNLMPKRAYDKTIPTLQQMDEPVSVVNVRDHMELRLTNFGLNNTLDIHA